MPAYGAITNRSSAPLALQRPRDAAWIGGIEGHRSAMFRFGAETTSIHGRSATEGQRCRMNGRGAEGRRRRPPRCERKQAGSQGHPQRRPWPTSSTRKEISTMIEYLIGSRPPGALPSQGSNLAAAGDGSSSAVLVRSSHRPMRLRGHYVRPSVPREQHHPRPHRRAGFNMALETSSIADDF